MTRWRFFAFFAVIFTFLAGCDSNSGNLADFSIIEISPSNTNVEIDSGIGSTSFVITVRNTGQGRDLTVSDVVLNYTPINDAEANDGPAFTLTKGDLPKVLNPVGEGDGTSETYLFTVKYRDVGDGGVRSATVTIVNDNTQISELRNLTITFSTTLCSPVIDIPSEVDFGTVTVAEPYTERDIILSNPGACSIWIDWFQLQGDASFSMTVDDVVYTASTDPTPHQFASPVEIKANSSIIWPGKFSPSSGEPTEASLTIHSNDSMTVDGTDEILLIGNSRGPLLEVTPNPIEFGGKILDKVAGIDVSLASIGTGDVTITGIVLSEDSNPAFSLDFSVSASGEPSEETPLTLEPATNGAVRVRYQPTTAYSEGPDGEIIMDTAKLIITNNLFAGVTEVDITGFGVTAECPQPVIVVEEGEEVTPGETLHLHGEQSDPANGEITQYNWSVEQPEDNKFIFVPGSSYEAPSHEVNVGGEYTYCLDVCDAEHCSSDESCRTTACKKIVVLPEEAIRCEVTWYTPGDADEYDSGEDAGTDMDLHFTHPFATGPDLDKDGKPDGWFDVPYDVFWHNKTPEWESQNSNANDNPILNRDDTDGAGPEIVSLRAPVSGRVYRVGVHYWDHHGYGISYPRLKCYVWSQLAFDRDLGPDGLNQPLYRCDMWEAATIEWPKGTVTAVTNPDGTLKITKEYENEAFVQIGGSHCN